MALQDKLDDYNAIYRFRENPEHFSFSFSPERVIIRNEALRTGNKELYETFLRERYPDHGLCAAFCYQWQENGLDRCQ